MIIIRFIKLTLFLASRGSYVSKILKESAKPLRTQQQHAHDQKAKDAQVSKLKTPSIKPSFRQRKLQFPPVQKSPQLQRDELLREEQRHEDKEAEEDEADELIMDALMGEACSNNEGLEVQMTYQELLNDVDKKLAKGKDEYMPRIVADLHLLRQFTQQLLKQGPYRLGKMEASLLVARSNHRLNDGQTLARRIRGLFNYYRQWHGFPQEPRGGKRQDASFLDNEDVFLACRTWLISQELGTISPNDFLNAVNQEILPRLLTTMDRPIARSTAYLWLPRLGFHRHETRKGLYVDGHERPDVISYRQEVFLPLMKELLSYTVQYEEDEAGTWHTIQPSLPTGVQLHVMYFHDESCFHGHDYKKRLWLADSQQKMPGKSKGRLIHISEFIGPEGRIRVPNDKGIFIPDDLNLDARQTIYPGSNGDPWWDTKQLLVQVTRTLDIFEKKHPNCVAVLIFDQSSAHASHGEGALNAFAMNKSPGGVEKGKIKAYGRDTYFPPECTILELQGTIQVLWQLNKDGEKEPKGVEQILIERGCNIAGLRFKCPKEAKCTALLKYPPPIEQKCCLARILSNHQDFFEEKSQIEELIMERGHKAVFLPKFHCEINPIEMYWGYSKTRYRQVKKASFPDAKVKVVEALEACSIDIIRRFCNRTFRWMDAYRQGLTIKQAAWCVKKQKGHRTISKNVMDEWDKMQE